MTQPSFLCRCGDPKDAHAPTCTAVVVGIKCSCPAYEPLGAPRRRMLLYHALRRQLFQLRSRPPGVTG